MDIRLKTSFANPALPYVPSPIVARDDFNRAASDLTATPIGGLEYLTHNSQGLKPIAATDGALAYFRSGVGQGASYCTVHAPPADLFQISSAQVDADEHAAIVVLQYGDVSHWLAMMRVSKAAPYWRLARNDGGGAVTVVDTGVEMGPTSFRRDYADGSMRVRMGGQLIWSGLPMAGAPRAGFGIFPGTAWQATRFDYLSVNYEA